MQPNICLIILFNHNYEGNVPKLRKIYGERFSHIRFLMPFYQGHDPDVIRVYGSSEIYQGFLAQAYPQVAGSSFTHYLVVGDDVLLHPDLDETNLLERFALAPGEAYITHLFPLEAFGFHWVHTYRIIDALMASFAYVNYHRLLPPPEEFRKMRERLGLPMPQPMHFRPRDYWRNLAKGMTGKTRHFLSWYWKSRTYQRRMESRPDPILPYFLMGYSDLLICPAQTFESFCYLCGILAAMNVWVESAIPTALGLTHEAIRTVNRTTGEAQILWSDDRHRLKEGVPADFEAFYREIFSGNLLYIHPVKLSQWAL